MLHIPVLRWGQPYTSLEVDEVVHFADGEPIAKVSRANGGLIQRDMRKAARAREALREIPIEELVALAGRAGELYMDATLPMGDGTQSPDEFVRALPEGYDTVVGERGFTLSGGQRQRLSIARTLLVNPPILVLDDALSAVDTYTEEEILARLRSVMRRRTSIIVSHRISTVRDADLIVVLDQGRVAETGTHASLLARGGLYARLVSRQLASVYAPAAS